MRMIDADELIRRIDCLEFADEETEKMYKLASCVLKAFISTMAGEENDDRRTEEEI